MKLEYIETWAKLANPQRQDWVKNIVLILTFLIALFMLLVVVLTGAYLHKLQIL